MWVPNRCDMTKRLTALKRAEEIKRIKATVNQIGSWILSALILPFTCLFNCSRRDGHMPVVEEVSRIEKSPLLPTVESDSKIHTASDNVPRVSE